MKKVDPFATTVEQPVKKTRPLWVTIGILFIVFFVVIPLLSTFLFDEKSVGNVAIIPIHGVITGDGEASYMYGQTVSSLQIIDYIN